MVKKVKKQKKEKVDYLYADLSKVETKALKTAHQGYRLLLMNKRYQGDHPIALDAIHRIEGELLARKELVFKR